MIGPRPSAQELGLSTGRGGATVPSLAGARGP